MVCVIKLRGLQQLSPRDTVWLVTCVSTYVLLLVLLVRHLVTFADSMAVVATVLKRQEEAKILRSQFPNTKFILLWNHKTLILNRFDECNSSAFDCFWTDNKYLFGGDYSYFDAVIFDESHFKNKWRPIRRTPTQLYIFTSGDSPASYAACELHNEGFFNWTFTYRLDSDVVWKFFAVRNVSGDIIAPSADVRWNKKKGPIRQDLKNILQGKKQAAAWIVNDCQTSSRDQHLMNLQEQLSQYSLKIDIYGNCAKRKCGENGDCEAMIRNNYLFYIAFENALDDDYVTREVLRGYNNYAVPIVYGGADYNRFLPPGSFIDARVFHPRHLAHIINVSMKNPNIYEAFFGWTNLYTIDSNYSSYNPKCDLCKAMYSEKAKGAPAKQNFRYWWNTPNGMKWCLPDQFRIQNNKNKLNNYQILR